MKVQFIEEAQTEVSVHLGCLRVVACGLKFPSQLFCNDLLIF